MGVKARSVDVGVHVEAVVGRRRDELTRLNERMAVAADDDDVEAIIVSEDRLWMKDELRWTWIGLVISTSVARHARSIQPRRVSSRPPVPLSLYEDNDPTKQAFVAGPCGSCPSTYEYIKESLVLLWARDSQVNVQRWQCKTRLQKQNFYYKPALGLCVMDGTYTTDTSSSSSSSSSPRLLPPIETDDRKIVRKIERDPWNRLRSIKEDAQWVSNVSRCIPHAPLVPNLRCGAWYVYPDVKGNTNNDEDNETFCYFKSTDGHADQWSFSLKRPNLAVASLLQRHGSVIVVDSTRRGKVGENVVVGKLNRIDADVSVVFISPYPML